MAKLMKKVVDTKIKRVLTTTASVIIIATMILTLIPVLNSANAYASDGGTEAGNLQLESVWALKIGDEEILYVDSNESANQVIEGLRNYYLDKDAEIIEVIFDKEIKAEEKKFDAAEFRKKDIQLSNVQDAIKYIVEGRKEYKVYVSEKVDITKSMPGEFSNGENGLSDFKEEAQVMVYDVAPFVNVTTIEKVTASKSIDYKTKYRNTYSLDRGKTKVSRKGEKGKKQVVSTVTKFNGTKISSNVVSEDVIKEPVTKIVLKGIGDVEAKRGGTYKFGDGEEVADFAKRYVGNPYSYGGTSLTRGADCSGFVLAVYDRFGIDLPHTASGQMSYGKGVSYSNAKPGDIIIYPGHAAMYIGNGKIVHAFNPSKGICITNARYDTILAVRRIFS
ncbi:MAG: NlpC/P60 family protein [Anaerovoracaceae bacterium]